MADHHRDEFVDAARDIRADQGIYSASPAPAAGQRRARSFPGLSCAAKAPVGNAYMTRLVSKVRTDPNFSLEDDRNIFHTATSRLHRRCRSSPLAPFYFLISSSC